MVYPRGMESRAPSATAKDVELTEVSAASSGKEENEDGKILFCTHVGWEGALVLLSVFGISGLFVYITFLYTKKFKAWHRPWVWVFPVLAAIYLLLGLWLSFRWKQIALVAKVDSTTGGHGIRRRRRRNARQLLLRRRRRRRRRRQRPQNRTRRRRRKRRRQTTRATRTRTRTRTR